MARSNPGHRRRPGRRPPHLPSAGAFPSNPRPQGFTGPGMRQLFDGVLPMRGRERREFFNQASTGLVVGLGLGGAVLGHSWAGPVGALIGLGVGATTGGLFIEKQRFYRR
jgi:hypothetical protein